MQKGDELIPISVFYIVKNEEHKLKESLESVSWADEIIVVDSGSTDKTVAIAKQAGAKVFFREWEGYGQQKRYAEELCRNDWVLNLDGDEVLSNKLIDEILNLDINENDIAFNMRWMDYWFTRFVHPLQRRKRRVRLYNKSKVRFRNHPSHDSVVVSKDQVKELDGMMMHFSFPSIQKAVEKINGYTEMTSDLQEHKPSTLSLVIVFPVAFLKAYLLRRNFLSGFDGFVVSMLFAFQRFLRLAKAWEKNSRQM